MIDGYGSLINYEDEQGHVIPFLTTDEILVQLQRFGFYVVYEMVEDLPTQILSYISALNSIGYDKINRVYVSDDWLTPRTIVMKSEHNTDLIHYGTRIAQNHFNEKLANGDILVVDKEKGMTWDWVTQCFNIEDIIQENSESSD